MKAKNTLMIFTCGVVLGIVASAVAASGAETGLFGPEVSDRQECEGAVSVLLQRKKEALDRRERTIKARESDILAAEQRMRQQFEELSSLRNEIRERMKDMDDAQLVEVERLVKMFEKMRGKQSAAILQEAEQDIAIEVLRRMGPGKAGAALAGMDKKKAANIAEQMADHPINRQLEQ